MNNRLHPGTLEGYDLRHLPLEIARGLLREEFDADYYIARNLDVDFAVIADAFEHYYNTGWREGRDPSSRFSTQAYLQANADVASGGVNPLLHYVVRGRAEGRNTPSPFTALANPPIASPPSAIPTSQPPVLASGGTHTLDVEMEMLREHFNPQFYAEQYPDMRRPGTHQLEHYCVFGWKEQRDPCAAFSTRLYLLYNRDIAESGVNPFFHFILLGRQQGRMTYPSGFTGARSLALDPDAKLVTDPTLRDLIRFVPQPSRQTRQKYDPRHLMIDWLVPDFSVGGGGHMTIFRIIRWLEFFGHTCRIWISDLEIHKNDSELYDDIVKHFQTLRAAVRMADDGLDEATGDVLFATGWQTVARSMSVTGFRERAYLVQDLEYSFYPEGSYASAARWTYTQDLACICASPWLAETLSAEFGRWTRHFALAYDIDRYYLPSTPIELDEMPRIAVYGRVTAARRCVELVLLALEHLASQGVRFAAHLFGADFDSVAAPFPCVVHGILTPAALGDLYRRCAVGICLSGTNYSLVPQEMMACGLPVLEIDAPCTRVVFPDGAVTRAQGHPVNIASAIREMLRSPKRRKRQAAAALDWLNGTTWERSARSVERAIQERLAERGHPKQQARTRPTAAQKPYASVCIPTWNGGQTLARVIQRVEQQRCPWAFETVIIDSSSDDGSIETLPVSDRLMVNVIDRAEFQHGRTRNWLADMSRGAFVAFLTQDACPADEFWLYNLVTTLEHYPQAGGAFGRHMAWPDASPFVKRDIEKHFASFDRYPLAVSRETDAQKWASRDEAWRQMLHFFSDNNSCIRRSVWERHPLPEIDYGEDQVWANSIIDIGLQRVYAPGATVYHSHEYRPRDLLLRAETEVRYFKKHFGYQLFDGHVPLEEQIAAKNAADAIWARANGIDPEALTRQLSANAAWLQGASRAVHEAHPAFIPPCGRKSVKSPPNPTRSRPIVTPHRPLPGYPYIVCTGDPRAKS